MTPSDPAVAKQILQEASNFLIGDLGFVRSWSETRNRQKPLRPGQSSRGYEARGGEEGGAEKISARWHYN
jgi:hypothetical protein